MEKNEIVNFFGARDVSTFVSFFIVIAVVALAIFAYNAGYDLGKDLALSK